MPIPNDLREIFNMVVKATNEGRHIWTEGPSPQMLFLNLDDFSAQLWKKYVSAGVIHGGARWPISFSIFDKRGVPIKSTELNPGDPE